MRLALGLVDDMAGWLKSNLETHLVAERGQWADGIPLPGPNEIIRRDPDDPRRMSNPPYLYVVVSRSQIYDWRRDYALANHQLVLWLVAQDSDVERLRVMIYRYGNVLWKAMVAADGELSYRMALPAAAVMPEMDYGETLTKGNVAMGDVRLITWWAQGEA